MTSAGTIKVKNGTIRNSINKNVFSEYANVLASSS